MLSIGVEGAGLIDAPPALTDVLVRGTDWNDGFLDFLDGEGLGHQPRNSRAIEFLKVTANSIRFPENIDTIVLCFQRRRPRRTR